MRIMIENEMGEQPLTPPPASEAPEATDPASQTATATSPEVALPADGTQSAETPTDQPPLITSETDTPLQPESATAPERPQEPETPQQKAERKAKGRLFLLLEDGYDLNDAEMATLHEQYDNLPIDELAELYNVYTPDWVFDPVTNEFSNPLGTAGETPAEDTPNGEKAADDDVAETEAEPLPFDNIESVEPKGEKSPETQTADGTSKAIEALYRDAAWKEFYKKNLPSIIEEKFKNKYPPATKYEALDDEDKAIVEAEFKTFLKEVFMPKVAAGEFGKDQEKSFIDSLKAGGMEWMVKGYEGGDMATFFKNFFLQDAYRNGAEASSFTYNEAEDKGEAIEVKDLKELCNWSEEQGMTEQNKQNWMMLCALIYRELQDTNKIDLRTWTSKDQLDTNSMKKHMAELFELCTASGKGKVNEALVKAFEPENGNSTFRKPGFTDAYATQNLIAHFQMMANHTDYTENFFR